MKKLALYACLAGATVAALLVDAMIITGMVGG